MASSIATSTLEATALMRFQRRSAAIARYAPRGAELPPGLPDAQPWVSRKSELWAHNTDGYYEEAVTRQWNATTDIPWDRLDGEELPEATGKALSQLMTFLTEVEMIATDTPAMWLPRLNPDFIEVKAFIAAQAMDEARHAEVFRKRALTTGYRPDAGQSTQ